jgi:hypothetical protein
MTANSSILRRLRTSTFGRLLAAGALPLALVAAGCGSSSPGSSPSATSASRHALSPQATLRRAAYVSSAAAGERLAINSIVTSTQLPTPVTVTGTGSVSPASHTGQLTMAMNLGSNPAVTAALGSSTLNMRELLDGGTIYLQLPSTLVSKLPGARPWLKINLAQAAAKASIPGLSTLLNNPVASNPGQFLQLLRAASGSVRRIGSATIGGQRATEYSATVDLSKAAAVAPAGERAALSQTITELEHTTGVTKLPLHVWVDSQQRVRRMSFTLGANVKGQQISTALTMTVLAYGPQPAPRIPAASQVTNITNLLGG